jgi:branched-chain amino acid transport system permease protein
MQTFLTLLVLSLVSASTYAVAASGLVLTYTTSGIFNFGHGAIAMFSAFVYWQLSSPDAWHLPVPIALVLTLFVFAPGMGWFIDWLIMRRLGNAGPMVRIVVPIGLLVSLISLASIIWPPDTINASLPFFFAGEKITVAGIAVTYHQLIVVAVAIAVAVALWALLYRTKTGIAMRAVVESRDLTALNGANPARLSGLSWALGCALAGVAGILIGPLLSLDQVTLTLLVINAFAAALVGRLRSLPLTYVGALILGFAVEVVRKWGSAPPSWLPFDWPWWLTVDTVPVLMLFIVLIVVPQDKAALFAVDKDRGRVPTISTRTAVIAAAVLVAVVAMVPSLMTGDILDAVGYGLGLGLIVVSLVPLTGYAGQISLAPMAFAGIGAVVMNDVAGKSGNPLALILVMAVCAVVGAIVALPAIRLKGLYLALATMSFAFFCEKSLFTRVMARTDLGSYKPLTIFGLSATSQRAQLVTMAVAIGLVGIGLTVLRQGKFGRQLQAMKDSPAAASTLGINLTFLKIRVFALSAAIAGLGGALLGIWRGSFNIEQFSLINGSQPGLPLVLMAVVGGIAAVAGVLLGAMLFSVFPMVGATYPALKDILNLLPGVAGLGLAANPSGAIAQTVDQVQTRIAERREHRPPAPSKWRTAFAGLVEKPSGFVPETIPIGASAPDRATIARIDAEIGLDRGRCHGDPADR